jgi:hypothetical protein
MKDKTVKHSVWGGGTRGKGVNGEDEDGAIGLMGFISIKEIE